MSVRNALTARNVLTSVRLAAVMSVGLLMVACATHPIIRTQAAVNANLANYHTFAFMAKPGTDKDGYKSLTTQSLERAVGREMLARGYTPVTDGAPPDLLINFNLKTKDKVQGDVGPDVWGGYGWGRHWGYGAGFGFDGYYNDIQTVTEGSLIIDLVDRARDEVVWSGTAVGELTKKVLDNPDPVIDRSVTQIFARYPVGPARR